MDVIITNTAELKFEIERLKNQKNEQENAIKQHFNSPRAILGTITSFFNKNKTGDRIIVPGKYDISSLISKYILPFTLNKTLFRKSNFVIKALVALASRKAAGLLNDKRVSALWDKIKSQLPESLVEKVVPKKRNSIFGLLSSKKNKEQKALKSTNSPIDERFSIYH